MSEGLEESVGVLRDAGLIVFEFHSSDAALVEAHARFAEWFFPVAVTRGIADPQKWIESFLTTASAGSSAKVQAVEQITICKARHEAG